MAITPSDEKRVDGWDVRHIVADMFTKGQSGTLDHYGVLDPSGNCWSDYIDYWAVDWDFQNDTFMQGWVTYRTRRDRTLALTSDPYTYEELGRYQVLVKVVDIFGNDTSQVFEVEVQ